MAAVLACGPDAVLSHRAAGQLWRILPLAPALPEVTRPRAYRQRPGITTHRGSLRDDEVELVGGIPATSPARTVFDLAALLPERQLERAWNELEARRLTSRVSAPKLIERYPGRRGAAALRRLLESERPGGITRNDFEELFVAFLDREGLPRPHLNADLALRGRFIEVDCLWRGQRVALELDGRDVHARKAAFESDRRRDRELLVAGWRPARVTWRQLRDEPRALTADLRRLLGVGE
jgi:very-short-patch-repair endonuclease